MELVIFESIINLKCINCKTLIGYQLNQNIFP